MKAKAPKSKTKGMNWRFLVSRLEDKELLARVVVVGEFNDTAVPVGGKRRGGYCQVAGKRDAEAVVAELSKYPGFPNLRFEPAGQGLSNGWVHWGDPEPVRKRSPRGQALQTSAQHDLERGRHFGYSEKVIRKFIAKSYGKEVAGLVFGVEVTEVAKKPTGK